MKAKILWTLAAIFTFLFFVVIYMPASFLLQGQPLPKGLQVYGISGTVWHGKAQAMVIQGTPVADIEWDLSGLSVLVGVINAEVAGGNLRDADEVSFKGNVQTSLFAPDIIKSDDFLLFMPADRVLARVPLPLPVNAGGRFRARIGNLSFGPDCNQLSGSGDWLNATVAGTRGPIDFGSYSAELRCVDKGLGIKVNEPNMLGLTLDVVLEQGFKSFTIDGRFKIDDALPPEVHDAAAIFGAPGDDGYTRITM